MEVRVVAFLQVLREVLEEVVLMQPLLILQMSLDQEILLLQALLKEIQVELVMVYLVVLGEAVVAVELVVLVMLLILQMLEMVETELLLQ